MKIKSIKTKTKVSRCRARPRIGSFKTEPSRGL